jgi:hypothetical protein
MQVEVDASRRVRGPVRRLQRLCKSNYLTFYLIRMITLDVDDLTIERKAKD